MKTPLGTEVDLGTGHIVLDGFPALRERGTVPPFLRPCLLWPRLPISATAELLLTGDIRRCGDGAGSTIEENSIVFSLI